MEEKQISGKTSDDLKRHTIASTPASHAPPRLEPTRQNTPGLRGLLARTKSVSNQPDDIRADATTEVPVALSKTELKDQRVGTHRTCRLVEWQLMLVGK